MVAEFLDLINKPCNLVLRVFFLPVSFAPQGRLGENPTNEIANRDPANMAIKKQTTKKWADVTCLCMIALGNKTVPHTFLLSFDITNGRLCHEVVEIQKFCY